jgi:large subunit ribosomal protein L18
MAKQETVFDRRKRRTRYKLSERRNARLRLSVFRSGQHMYAQVIDDVLGKTVASASTVEKEVRGKVKVSSNKEAAKLVGELIAQRAKAAKITEVVFDRGGYLYHGRVKELGEAARNAGLAF